MNTTPQKHESCGNRGLRASQKMFTCENWVSLISRPRPSAFIGGQTKSQAEAETIWTSLRRNVARGRRFNEDIYLPTEQLAPSARAENIDRRRQPAHSSERSNSILKNEEPERNYRAAAASTDHLSSALLIADNKRMKNGRKSSSRRYWCWLNGRLVAEWAGWAGARPCSRWGVKNLIFSQHDLGSVWKSSWGKMKTSLKSHQGKLHWWKPPPLKDFRHKVE